MSHSIQALHTPEEANGPSSSGLEAPGVPEPEKHSWYTPKRLLAIFCVINMINYLDRGAIASNGVNGDPGDPKCTAEEPCSRGTGIQGDFHLSNFQDGILPAAFMVGLLVASPIFAQHAKRHNPFRLIGVGLAVWMVAVAGCGLSTGFLSLTFCRMFVGVGEASFISLAAPFINDAAPPSQVTVWLALFYMCIPVGIAFGYLYGAAMAAISGWRLAFFVEALMMAPFVIFGFFAEPAPLGEPQRVKEGSGEEGGKPQKEGSSGGGQQDVFGGIVQDCKVLLQNRVWVANAGALATYAAVLGCYAYFGPKVARALFHIEDADMVFGLITVITGVFGTLVGGMIVDRMGATIPNSFGFMAVTTFIGTLFSLAAFLAPSATLFCWFIGVAELFLFAIQGPANIVTLECVPPSQRPMSVAFITILQHLLGDVPSPPLFGRLQDITHNWRVTTSVLCCVLFGTVAFFWWGAWLPDMADEPGHHRLTTQPQEPLVIGSSTSNGYGTIVTDERQPSVKNGGSEAPNAPLLASPGSNV